MRRLRLCGASPREIAVALAGCALPVVVIALSALLGGATLGPDSLLDLDPLYRVGSPPAGAVLNDRTPAVIDLPRDLTLARQLHLGYWPRWNPLSAAGAPLWAEQGGPFFPLKLPFYLVPTLAAHKVFLCLRLVVAGLGAYLLARHRGLRHWPAVVAGIAFELCGAVVENFAFSAASGQCLLPWVVLGAAALARRRDARAAVWATAALALTAASGHPTVALVVFIAFAAAVAGHLATLWRQPRALAQLAAWSAASVVLALMLAAPSLLPFAELMTQGQLYKTRSTGLDAWGQALAQARASLVPALFAPHVMQSTRERFVLVHLAGPALGVVPLVLGLAGLLAGALDAALLAVGGVGIILAVEPPGFHWIAAVPGVRLIVPTYAWVLIALPLTQAAGAALQQCGTAAGRRRILLALALSSGGLAVLATARDVGWAAILGVRQAALHSRGGLLLFAGPFAATAAAVGVCYALARTRAARCGPALLGLLAVGELLLLWTPFLRQPRARALVDPASPAVAYLQRQLSGGDGRFVGVPILVGYPTTSMLFGLPDLRGCAGLPVRRYLEYMQSIDPGGSAFTLQGTSVTRSPLLDLAAVRYVVEYNTGLAPPLLDGDPGMPLAYADRWVRIYENLAALPRVRVVHRLERATDQAAARLAVREAAARAPHAAGTGLDRVAIVEPDAAGAFPSPLADAGSLPEAVRIVDDADPDRLLLTAELAAPGLVVVADTFYPGWRAWVDGVETPIHPADLLFRAIHVPAGVHAIELRYEPIPARVGLLVALLAAAICVALFRRGGRAARGPTAG